ncbi:MAG: 16S rRNA (guanine(966)-N(2))-methyltransferase RsmD [Lachnospiraceae bacterium]|nr:16S rRNA (guanine(966)-N(2))-methyltransferase RsmD [Lachnospiraceae bacterium]
MRVISGIAGRRKLVSPPGMDIRPTTDRIKETLFNILAPYIYDSDFLDLFAGSGGIGIEALSRGAGSAVFVDNSNTALNCVKKNLEITGLNSNAEVLRMDACAAVSRLYTMRKKFDIIFIDPPYKQEIEKNVLFQLDKNRILKEDGMIIVEASSDTGFDYIEDTCFKISREKKYGSNKHLFIAYK